MSHKKHNYKKNNTIIRISTATVLQTLQHYYLLVYVKMNHKNNLGIYWPLSNQQLIALSFKHSEPSQAFIQIIVKCPFLNAKIIAREVETGSNARKSRILLKNLREYISNLIKVREISGALEIRDKRNLIDQRSVGFC